MNWNLEYDDVGKNIIPLWNKLIINRRWDLLFLMIQMFNEAKIQAHKSGNETIELDLITVSPATESNCSNYGN